MEGFRFYWTICWWHWGLGFYTAKIPTTFPYVSLSVQVGPLIVGMWYAAKEMEGTPWLKLKD